MISTEDFVRYGEMNYICSNIVKRKSKIIMKTTTQEALNILRKFKQTRGDVYGIEEIGLFGSTARGEQQEDSDIDVCMKTSRTIDLFDLQDLRDELEHLFRKKVDLLTLHENMRRLFRNNIERDAIFV